MEAFKGFRCVLIASLVLVSGRISMGDFTTPASTPCLVADPGVIIWSNIAQPYSGARCDVPGDTTQVQVWKLACVTVSCPPSQTCTCGTADSKWIDDGEHLLCLRTIHQNEPNLHRCCEGYQEDSTHACVPIPTTTTTTTTTTGTTTSTSTSTVTPSPTSTFSTTPIPFEPVLGLLQSFPFQYIIAIVVGGAGLLLLLLLLLIICCCCRRRRKNAPEMEKKPPVVFVVAIPEPEKKTMDDDEVVIPYKKVDPDYDDLDAIKFGGSEKLGGSTDVVVDLMGRTENVYSEEPSRVKPAVSCKPSTGSWKKRNGNGEDGIYEEIKDGGAVAADPNSTNT